jgi:hypothetical protein
MNEEEPAMPTGYWKKDGQPEKKDEATKDAEGHIFRNDDDTEGHKLRNDDDTEGHKLRNDDDTEGHSLRNDEDVEGHSFIVDTEMNRALARQREKDIQRNLRSESKRPFFRRGR